MPSNETTKRVIHKKNVKYFKKNFFSFKKYKKAKTKKPNLK